MINMYILVHYCTNKPHAQITFSNAYTNVHNNGALFLYCLTRIHFCMYMYDWFYFVYTHHE